MGYFVEISFDIIKTNNFLDIKKNIIEISEQCKKKYHYVNHEIMGKNRTTYRNHYIMSFFFNENEELVADFIRNVKKIRYVNIETIGYDNCVFKLMYASRKYLNIMDKFKAKEYLQKKRENTLYKSDSVIITAVYKK